VALTEAARARGITIELLAEITDSKRTREFESATPAAVSPTSS
jgi:hypothetical protein